MIFATVNPSVVLKLEFDNSNIDCVVNLFELSSGAVFDETSLKDWVAKALTLNTVAPPLVNPPKPNNSVSADERIDVEPPVCDAARNHVLAAGLSEKISKDLKQKGFKFIGPTVVYSYMQAIGMVNDHLESCFRHSEVILKR